MIKSPQQNKQGELGYSAIIYQEGDYTIAEDFNGSKLKEDSVDAAKVFQGAIDSLPNGGQIFVKLPESGVYETQSKIEMKYGNTRITGESKYKCLLRATATYTPMLKIKDTVGGITAEFISFNGNAKTATVIDASRATSAPYDTMYRGCNIIGATSKNMVLTNREEQVISDCHIGDATLSSPYNIYVGALDGWLILNNRTIVHNATTDSIYFYGRELVIDTAEVYAKSGAQSQIRIVSGRLRMTNGWTEQWLVRGVVGGGSSAEVSTVNGYIAGGFSGTFGWIQFNGDYMISNFTHDIDLTVGIKGVRGSVDVDGSINISGRHHLWDIKDHVWRSNLVNSDWGQGTGATQTIPHLLAATPNNVIIWDTSEGANAFQDGSSDATNIYIKAVNTKYYGWKAEVTT